MALTAAGHVAQIFISFSSCRSSSFFFFSSFRSLIYAARHFQIAHGVPFHTQLRLNASLRIGTSVAVEHDSLSDSVTR